MLEFVILSIMIENAYGFSHFQPGRVLCSDGREKATMYTGSYAMYIAEIRRLRVRFTSGAQNHFSEFAIKIE